MKHPEVSLLRMRDASRPFFNWRRWFFGCPLHNTHLKHEKVGLWAGLTLLGADALSSVAYASEEILLALMVLGPSSFFLSLPISVGILTMMVIIILSYRQTVEAYPQGGGAYSIARHELGEKPALIAAASLLLDYVLTVTVSVAAGVRAIISFVPELYSHTLTLALGAVCLLGWLSLRGVKESARFLAIPMFLFLGGILSLIMLGLYQKWDIFTETIFSHPSSSAAEDFVFSLGTAFVILRAFAGGCTAMTGIEAIANAVTIFKEPAVKHAQTLYLYLVCFLGVLFGGVSLLAYLYHSVPLETESLISNLGRQIFGNGWMHKGLQAVTAIILFLAANTAFSGYPRLCAVLAQDYWLPKQLSQLGDRLVYHKGILLLMALSSFLLVLFNADVHRLIPLYALGVMTAFTLSQLGVVRYWKRLRQPTKGLISLGGATVTGIVFFVFLEAKFFEGAFLFPILIMAIMACFKAVHTHYQSVEKQLRISSDQTERHRAFSHLRGRHVLVPISRMHLGSLEALAFGREMTTDVEAILVNVHPDFTQRAQQDIHELGWGVKVTVLESPYRSIMGPLLHYVSSLKQDTVLIFPEIIPPRWWQNYLHNETVVHLVRALEQQIPHPGSTRVIITVPYHLK